MHITPFTGSANVFEIPLPPSMGCLMPFERSTTMKSILGESRTVQRSIFESCITSLSLCWHGNFIFLLTRRGKADRQQKPWSNRLNVLYWWHCQMLQCVRISLHQRSNCIYFPYLNYYLHWVALQCACNFMLFARIWCACSTAEVAPVLAFALPM